MYVTIIVIIHISFQLCFAFIRVAPYQIALHDGRLIFAPQDNDQVIRLRPPAAPGAPSSPEINFGAFHFFRSPLLLSMFYKLLSLSAADYENDDEEGDEDYEDQDEDGAGEGAQK